MDYLTKYAALMPRKHSSQIPLQAAGFIPRKTSWMKQTFHVYAFSFILKGEGFFMYNGVTYPVVAPMVITQWPGAYLEYGPSPKSNYWTEVYFVYKPESIPQLESLEYIQPGRYLWKIFSLDKTIEAIQRLYDLSILESTSLQGDWMDRYAEEALLRSHEQPVVKPISEIDRKFEAIEKEVRKSFRISISFDELAQKHGLSYTHFRRLWTQRKGISPGRFQSELQIHEACRLLVETSMRISEIAVKVGCEDPLYFSRKFKGLMNRGPQEYRAAFQLSKS
ncbi:MAG: AraC family transcriptional regulator [Verrucomicrobiota bacterium]